MEHYNNEVIRKLFNIFNKLEINPEDFVKHIDEDDYIDSDEFKRAFFNYLITRAHLEKYIDEQAELNESGGKSDCDDVFKKIIIYAISRNPEKYNHLVNVFTDNIKQYFEDDDRFTGGDNDRLVDKLYFYWSM